MTEVRDLQVGDSVDLMYNGKTEISGVVTRISSVSLAIDDLYFASPLVKVLNVRRVYKDGDIGLLTSSDGSHYVGIYQRGIFVSSDSYYMRSDSPVFRPEVGKNIKVLGNVND